MTKYTKKQLAAVTAFAKGEEAQDTRTEKMHAEGLKYFDFKKSDPQCRDANFELCKQATIAGMPAKKRALILMEGREVPADSKKARREAQKAIGAYMGKMFRSLKKIQNPGAANSDQSEAQKIAEALAGLCKRAGKNDSGVPKAVIENLNKAVKAFG